MRGRPSPFVSVLVGGALSVFGFGSEALAQAERGVEAVDRGVSDSGPSATSLRRLDTGLSAFPDRYSVVRNPWAVGAGQGTNQADVAGLETREFVFRRPGVQAFMSTPDYLVLNRDGRLDRNVAAIHDDARILMLPADTVFNLDPARVVGRPGARRGQRALEVDTARGMVDYRIDLRVRAQQADHRIVRERDERGLGIATPVRTLRPDGSPPVDAEQADGSTLERVVLSPVDLRQGGTSSGGDQPVEVVEGVGPEEGGVVDEPGAGGAGVGAGESAGE